MLAWQARMASNDSLAAGQRMMDALMKFRAPAPVRNFTFARERTLLGSFEEMVPSQPVLPGCCATRRLALIEWRARAGGGLHDLFSADPYPQGSHGQPQSAGIAVSRDSPLDLPDDYFSSALRGLRSRTLWKSPRVHALGDGLLHRVP